MDGLWQGGYNGTNTGSLVLEIDDLGDNYHCTIYAAPNDLTQPRMVGTAIASKNKNKFSIKVSLTVNDRSSGLTIGKDTLAVLSLASLGPNTLTAIGPSNLERRQ